eukprot:TRINITY_DN67588_c0_g1_i1.p1 TRINITY_DN67588_c0_g1~~TRINITY_DN67588_c0_g1_i1.p1  ORF type:complete len:114 (+),score=2.82 TRINITY_DN67588_c0_g1_i1:140-481(+)
MSRFVSASSTEDWSDYTLRPKAEPCIVCQAAPRCVAFTPCQHKVCCEECSRKLCTPVPIDPNDLPLIDSSYTYRSSSSSSSPSFRTNQSYYTQNHSKCPMCNTEIASFLRIFE